MGLAILHGRFAAPRPPAAGAAREVLARGHFPGPKTWPGEALAVHPRDGGALLVAAEAAIHQKRPDAALDYYLQVADDCTARFGVGAIRCG